MNEREIDPEQYHYTQRGDLDVQTNLVESKAPSANSVPPPTNPYSTTAEDRQYHQTWNLGFETRWVELAHGVHTELTRKGHALRGAMSATYREGEVAAEQYHEDMGKPSFGPVRKSVESEAPSVNTVPPGTVATVGGVSVTVIRHAAQYLRRACHKAAFHSGWWNDLRTGETKTSIYREEDLRVNVGEKLMLIVSEVAEAMEADRKSKPGQPVMDNHLIDRPGLEVELADAVIRIFDLAGGLSLDLEGAIVDKLLYNAKRADHKVENRKADGGKAY